MTVKRLSTQIERDLYAWLLSEQSKGLVTAIEQQPMPLELPAHRCTYRPDARCIRNGRVEYYEAKGGYIDRRGKYHSHFERWEDGLVKLKVAAEYYKDVADFYVFERGKDQQICITQIPTMDSKAKSKMKI